MSNTNCLVGIACPRCKDEGPFWISPVTTAILLFDDGVMEYEGAEWDDAAYFRCTDCGHEGPASEFSV